MTDLTSRYSEVDTEKFYNQEDEKYRSFWDDEGSLHWGYFDGSEEKSADPFLHACQNWNKYMLQKSSIDKNSHILDLGCGNGAISLWLAKQTGCRAEGIDISRVRIDNANQKSRKNSDIKLTFTKASAMDLPFKDNYFTHVWSQAVMFHIPDMQQALKEIYRVLQPNGILIFDDLTQPKKDISQDARKYVYDRLIYDSSYSHDEYLKRLKMIGFKIIEDMDISDNLNKSYQLLQSKTKENYPELNFAYQKMCKAIDNKELGWSFFLTQK